MGELFVSHGCGRAAWCEFDHLEPYPESLIQTFDKANDLLVERGAYFDRPLGRLAEKFYAGNPSYVNQIKRVKEIVDPHRILNPDQLLIGV
jgi:FAD/FMN-containing dehydrogenase